MSDDSQSLELNFLSIDPADANPEGIGEDAPTLVGMAQETFRAALERMSDTDWSDNPLGPLAHHWNHPTGQSATYLINIAAAVGRFSHSITKRSRPLLDAKIATLFRPANPMVFEEALAELEVAAIISGRFSPIAMEPYVPEEDFESPKKPSSADYAIITPNGPAVIEVTVWHWERMIKWSRMIDQIHTVINRRVTQSGVTRDIRAVVPLSASPATREIMSHQDVSKQIIDKPSGRLEFDVSAGRPAVLEWQTFLHFEDEESVDWELIQTSGARAWSVGPGLVQQFSFSWNPDLVDDDIDNAVESLRRSIDRKRKQSPPDAIPYFVAVALHTDRIKWEWFGEVIEQRVWPNPKYHWLSGLLEYTPNRYSPLPAGQGLLMLAPNPNADVPVPPAIVAAFTQQEQYHFRDGSFGPMV